MLEPFVVPLREAIQCSVAVLLLLSLPGVRERAGGLLLGVLTGFAAGFFLSYIPGIADYIWSNETWLFARHLAEISIFYVPVALLAARAPGTGRAVSRPALFALGFLLFFFESRASGFLVHDIGLMKERAVAAPLLALAGTALGFAPLLFRKYLLRKLPLERALSLPAALVLIGALKLSMGGVGEVEAGNVLISLQRGIQFFLESAVDHMQYLFMLSDHQFINAPFAGLASYLSGDRMAMTLLVVFVTAPPVYLLVTLVSRPDPLVSAAEKAAHRRLRVAFFRRELINQVMPVLAALLIIIVSLHAANVSLNPLSEPVPLPVREAEGAPGVLRIPLSDRMGDFSDGKLRKYVYYHGNKQIVFLAILKPDGTVGLALDECEICKPAEWNKAAQGYAQRGDHLVCKYCMTPIPIPTVNKPGGCNPIPISFTVEEGNIQVALDDLVRVWKSAKEMEKKGTHL